MGERPKFWSKQSLTDGAKFAAAITLVLAVFISLIVIWAVTLSGGLPNDVRTIAEFEHQMPNPAEVWLRTVRGREVFVVVGRKDVQSLSFGPPVYIFDREGRFVSWVYDVGDDADEFQSFAYNSTDGELLTMSEAVARSRQMNRTHSQTP